MLIKKTLEAGVHAIAIPLATQMKLDDIFPKELTNSFIQKLDNNGKFTKKEQVIFSNNEFVVSDLYKTIQPLDTLRLTLKRAIEIEWEVDFKSLSHIKKGEVAISQGFDKDKALQLMQLCSLIYEKESVVKETALNRYKFDDIYYFSKQNHENFIKGNIFRLLHTFLNSKSSVVDLQFMQLNKYDESLKKELIVLVFQGSQEAEDWITNISLKHTDYFGGEKVHKGFYDSLKFFIKNIKNMNLTTKDKQLYSLSKDIDFINKNCKILITGHSLGGAIATLVASYLTDLGVDKESMDIYTFGAPPVGGEDFCQKYEKGLNLYRVVNENDIVPKIDKISSLNHFGEKIVLASNENEIHSCDDYIDNLIDL